VPPISFRSWARSLVHRKQDLPEIDAAGRSASADAPKRDRVSSAGLVVGLVFPTWRDIPPKFTATFGFRHEGQLVSISVLALELRAACERDRALIGKRAAGSRLTHGRIPLVQMRGRARGTAASRGKPISGGLGRRRERLHGLDADDGRDRGDLEAPPGIAEVLLDGRDIEPAGNLLRDPDGEAVAGGLKQPAPLDFVLERLALGLGALQHRVGVAECVWQALRLRDCGNGMW
jgi:hypothetical protein